MAPRHLGAQKEEGTVFLNVTIGKFGFRDKYTSEYVTGGNMSAAKMRKVLESDFHLFPNVGAQDNNSD